MCLLRLNGQPQVGSKPGNWERRHCLCSCMHNFGRVHRWKWECVFVHRVCFRTYLYVWIRGSACTSVSITETDWLIDYTCGFHIRGRRHFNHLLPQSLLSFSEMSCSVSVRSVGDAHLMSPLRCRERAGTASLLSGSLVKPIYSDALDVIWWRW